MGRPRKRSKLINAMEGYSFNTKLKYKIKQKEYRMSNSFFKTLSIIILCITCYVIGYRFFASSKTEYLILERKSISQFANIFQKTLDLVNENTKIKNEINISTNAESNEELNKALKGYHAEGTLLTDLTKNVTNLELSTKCNEVDLLDIKFIQDSTNLENSSKFYLSLPQVYNKSLSLESDNLSSLISNLNINTKINRIIMNSEILNILDISKDDMNYMLREYVRYFAECLPDKDIMTEKQILLELDGHTYVTNKYTIKYEHSNEALEKILTKLYKDERALIFLLEKIGGLMTLYGDAGYFENVDSEIIDILNNFKNITALKTFIKNQINECQVNAYDKYPIMEIYSYKDNIIKRTIYMNENVENKYTINTYKNFNTDLNIIEAITTKTYVDSSKNQIKENKIKMECIEENKKYDISFLKDNSEIFKLNFENNKDIKKVNLKIPKNDYYLNINLQNKISKIEEVDLSNIDYKNDINLSTITFKNMQSLVYNLLVNLQEFKSHNQKVVDLFQKGNVTKEVDINKNEMLIKAEVNTDFTNASQIANYVLQYIIQNPNDELICERELLSSSNGIGNRLKEKLNYNIPKVFALDDEKWYITVDSNLGNVNVFAGNIQLYPKLDSVRYLDTIYSKGT